MSTYLKRKEEMAWQTTRKISLKAYLVFSPPSFFSLLLLKAFLNLLCFELCDESERFLCCVPFPSYTMSLGGDFLYVSFIKKAKFAISLRIFFPRFPSQSQSYKCVKFQSILYLLVFGQQGRCCL